MDNRGRINNNSGPSGHTHSMYQLNDVAASGNNLDTLVQQNGIWTSVNGLPYIIATGTADITLGGGTTWSTGLKNVDLTAAPYNNPFTINPLVFATAGPNGTAGALIVQYNVLSPSSINLRLNYAGNSTSTITVSWIAIQIAPDSIEGYVSKDPSV